MIFALIFSSPCIASASEVSYGNIAYLSCEYDAPRELVTVSLNLCGEGISAIGVTVEYDAARLDYTSYSYGDDFEDLDVAATLDNGGEINVLAYGAEAFGFGEIIELCFKVKDAESADKLYFGLFPLSSKPAAIIDESGVRAVDVSFIGAECEICEPLSPMNYCGKSEMGHIILAPENYVSGECIFDITIVELSGKIRKTSIVASLDEMGFTIDLGDIGGGYTSVIAEPYYIKNNKKIPIERGIYLFFAGEYIG